MAHELKAKHIQAETLENKADDRLLLRSILSYIEDHSSSFEDEDVVSKRFVEERLSSIGEEKYIGSIASIESVDDDISDPEADMLIVTRDTLFVYWYDGDEWQQIGGAPSETPESIKTKYESNENTNAFTDAEKSKLAGIATGATKNANTDELDEGIENKYFTEARAVASKLAGYVKAATVSAITSATSILEAIGILEKALDNKVDKVAGSGLITDAEKLIFADKYTKNETDNLISGAISSLIWKDDVDEFADLATEYPDAIEGWTSVVNDENKIYRFDGTDWIPIGDITIPMATASVDGKMSKENFIKLRDIEDEATKNTNTDELDEGTTNKYFTDARAVAAKLAGYVKAETPIPLAEADSILQALGKLEGLLDTKLSIRGDNFIGTRPTADAIENGQQLILQYNELKSFTPGGMPLGSANRVTLIVMPGRYLIPTAVLILAEFVDIIGFGSKESIVLEATGGDVDSIISQPVNDVKVDNVTLSRGSLSHVSYSIQSDNTDKSVLRNLVLDNVVVTCFTPTPGSEALQGLYENIDCKDFDGFVRNMYESDGNVTGTFRNINGATVGTDFALYDDGGTYENCTLSFGYFDNRAVFKNCDIDVGVLILRGSSVYNSRIKVQDQAERVIVVYEGTTFGYCTFESLASQHILDIEDPNTPVNYNIHHCHIISGTISPNLINTITNGHNTWDAEGSEGIEDIIAGSNISIDKTDPKNPIISSFSGGGGGGGYETPFEVRDALQSLTGADRLDASAIMNLPQGFSGSWDDLTDKPSLFPPAAHTHDISDVSGLLAALSEKVDKEDGYSLLADADQLKIDAIDIDGDGTKFLTDDGTYKSELDPRTYIEESASGSVSIDLANKDAIHIEMSGNITSFNVTNPVVGKTYKIYMIQDSVGNRTLTGLDTKFKTENGIPILLTTDGDAVDLLQMDVFSLTDIKVFPVYNI